MRPEEVAKSHEGAYSFDVGGWFGIFDCFEFVLAWFDSLWSSVKPR